MSGAIKRYCIAREYELASFAFEDAHAQFQMAQASQGEVEQRAARFAAEYMESGFRHFALAESLQEVGQSVG